MSYTHLTEAERYDIYDRHREGSLLTRIALALGRSKSTVSRELTRNRKERGYRPRQAHERAVGREQTKRGGKRVCAGSWQRCDSCCSRATAQHRRWGGPVWKVWLE